jgi:hypothetical protein
MSATEQLADPRAWPETAAALARAGDPAVLTDLVIAYDQPVEASRSSLLDAMDALCGGGEAHRMAVSDDPNDRRVAARLMHLLPAPEHLPALERLVVDTIPTVAAAARRALRGQRRTAAWHAAVERLAARRRP